MKKSPENSRDRLERLVLVVARPACLWRGLAWGVAPLFTVVLLAATLDPDRTENARRQEEARRQARLHEEAARAALPIPTGRDGVAELSFRSLEFLPAGGGQGTPGADQSRGALAPSRILALDGKKVRISGFMLPTRVRGNLAQEFVILANQAACCFGVPPRLFEFIVARAPDIPVPLRMDQPLQFEGTLHVANPGLSRSWNGFYSMDCSNVSPVTNR